MPRNCHRSPYCINCEVYGHTACYTKCPKFPKPKNGNPITNRNKAFTSNNVEGISFANMVSGKPKIKDPQTPLAPKVIIRKDKVTQPLPSQMKLVHQTSMTSSVYSK
ncbi:uncharacterized protein TNCV_2863871 [Trichonephila clavipes]|nr:uncharacterized protein TNCV_2863871 [Trichonephila clavipes]